MALPASDTLLDDYPSWSFWLALLLIGGCVIATLVLAAGRLGLAIQVNPGQYLHITRPVAIAGLLLGLLALLLAPTTWALAAIANGEGGAWLPQAGPILLSVPRPGGRNVPHALWRRG